MRALAYTKIEAILEFSNSFIKQSIKTSKEDFITKSVYTLNIKNQFISKLKTVK